jgi:hypothetical protein
LTGGQGAAQRAAHVQAATAALPAPLGHAGGKLAGQRPDGLAQLPQLARVGVEDVEVVELAIAVQLGGLLGPPGGGEPVPDLLGDEAAEVVDARLERLTVHDAGRGRLSRSEQRPAW